MARDDWKYYDEDSWDEAEMEDEEERPSEVQCRNCLHFVPAEALYCPWCGHDLPKIPKK